jgi:hypothetical protein
MDIANYLNSNGTLVFTLTTFGYKHYSHNLWIQMQRLSSTKLLILCLDEESHAYFNSQNIQTQLFRPVGTGANQRGPAIFGSPAFKKFNALKVHALHDLQGAAKQLIYLDSDIGLYRDPVPYLEEQLEEAPLWYQCDEGAVGQCNPKGCPNACTGVIAIRVGSVSPELFVLEPRSWLKATTDQDYINDRMRSLAITFRTLTRPLFPNGVWPVGPPAFLYHFNYCLGDEKVARMRAADLWFV